MRCDQLLVLLVVEELAHLVRARVRARVRVRVRVGVRVRAHVVVEQQVGVARGGIVDVTRYANERVGE